MPRFVIAPVHYMKVMRNVPLHIKIRNKEKKNAFNRIKLLFFLFFFLLKFDPRMSSKTTAERITLYCLKIYYIYKIYQ